MGQNEVVYSSSSLGWAEINALDLPQTDEVTTQLKRGSPREILAAAEQTFTMTEVQLTYTMIRANQFNRAKHLIPPNILVGSNEPVPGVQPD